MRYQVGTTGQGGRSNWARIALLLCLALFSAWPLTGHAQENPLDKVETPAPPPPPKTPEELKPLIEGTDVVAKGASHPNARLRVDVNLVQVPVTVTDPMNRLVTGLEKENFQVLDNNVGQNIRYFSSEDAPLSMGIIFDLSGSMSTKFVRARKALTEFLRTSN